MRGVEPLTPCLQSRCSPTELHPPMKRNSSGTKFADKPVLFHRRGISLKRSELIACLIIHPLTPTHVGNTTHSRAIAYEITSPSLRRKPESRSYDMLDFRNGSNGLGHWIPAKAGMTIVKLPICDSPARTGPLSIEQVTIMLGWRPGIRSPAGDTARRASTASAQAGKQAAPPPGHQPQRRKPPAPACRC